MTTDNLAYKDIILDYSHIIPSKQSAPTKNISLFQAQTKAKTHKNTQLKFYPTGKVKITCFSREIYNDGWEDIREKDKADKKVYDLENPREDSLKRAKGKIFDIALSNDWKYMVTLTLDQTKINRYDKDIIVKPLTKWLDNQVQRKGLKYLVVPERHSDGAIHFHGLFNESLTMKHSNTFKIPQCKKPVKPSTVAKYHAIEQARPVYNINEWKLGFSTAVEIDQNVEAVSAYMTKYTCKDFQKIFGQSFFAGGGVNRELPSVVCDIPFNRVDAKSYTLQENLGEVKYLIIDTAELETFLRSVGVHSCEVFQ
jgi:hypothetical protein